MSRCGLRHWRAASNDLSSSSVVLSRPLCCRCYWTEWDQRKAVVTINTQEYFCSVKSSSVPQRSSVGMQGAALFQRCLVAAPGRTAGDRHCVLCLQCYCLVVVTVPQQPKGHSEHQIPDLLLHLYCVVLLIWDLCLISRGRNRSNIQFYDSNKSSSFLCLIIWSTAQQLVCEIRHNDLWRVQVDLLFCHKQWIKNICAFLD